MLRRSERWFRSLIENASDLVTVLDGDAIVRYESPSVARILGYDAAGRLGRSFFDFVHAEDLPDALALSARALATPVENVRFEFRCAHRDGMWRMLEGTARNLLGDPDVAGIVLNARDVTERRQIELQLRQAQRLEGIGQLAGGIAHEINTPVQYIGDNVRYMREGFASLLRFIAHYDAALQSLERDEPRAVVRDDLLLMRDELDIDYLSVAADEAATHALEGIERIVEIVRAMTAFSQPAVSTKVPTDLNQAILNTVTVARNVWKRVAIVITDLEPGLPPVPCLPGDLNQTILELLINATAAIEKAVTDGGGTGTIRITTRRDGAFIEIRIHDSGAGIPEAIRSRIFDPFFTTKQVGVGTGQGLAIAYATIVETHGGNLTFETEVSRGTTFIVRLPLA